MFYKNELQLLCDTLKKCHVGAFVTELSSFNSSTLKIAAENQFIDTPCINGKPEPHTVYRFTDSSDLSYVYLLLPETLAPTILFIGPFLTQTPAPERLLELGRKRGISPLRQTYLEEYYAGVTVLDDKSHLFIMLTVFCERIWKGSPFTVVDMGESTDAPVLPVGKSIQESEFDDILIKMKAMEKRYAFENELIQAVTLGQLHKESQLLAAFSDSSFEQRLSDPVRNAKNYGIIMNTLLRKAAEKGGVHPLYIDRVSSEFAHRIERLHKLSESRTLMCDMYRSYCRLVQKHSLTRYSLIVQKTALLIDSDLSASLSLGTLSRALNVSAGYLSAIFKKETGKTVSEYIREKRIKHAAHLLATTHLQIQTVALHCGIVDVQYFSKTFKKMIGKTPREYREHIKQHKRT